MAKIKTGIIGGCGSTGTTLLMYLLNRSPNICSGPELNLFNHKELYDIDKLKSDYGKLMRNKAASRGYFATNWFMTEREYYNLNHSIIDKWIDGASSTRSFVALLSDHILDRYGGKLFLEKTPTNAYCFKEFIECFPENPVIHVIRDGRDVVSSLMKRELNLYGAGSRWLYDTLSGLRIKGHNNYLEIKYEDLVTNPEAILKQVLLHLGLPDDPKQLISLNEKPNETNIEKNWNDHITLSAWTHRPTDPISKSSVGRYKKELNSSQLAFLDRIELTKKASTIINAEVTSFRELLVELGYKKRESNKSGFRIGLGERVPQEFSDMSRRIKYSVRIRHFEVPRRVTRIK